MKRTIDDIASDFIIGDDSVTELFRTKDWSSTLLGPLYNWPQSLRTAVSMCLKNPFPTLILWGPNFIQLYNIEYSRLIKDRHPLALGKPYKECWPELWEVAGPKYEQVYKTGEAIEGIDFPLPFPNEADVILERYFTFAYSPIYVEHNKLGGVLNTLNETTEKVISERQLKGLRDLYSQTTGATSIVSACNILAQTLQTMAVDISFSAIYLIRPAEQKLELVQVANISRATDITPEVVYLNIPTVLTEKQQVFAQVLIQVASTDEPQYFELKNYEVPASTVWVESPFPRGCVVLPIESANHKSTLGVLVAGLSPRRNLDENYKGFLNLVAMQIAAVLGNAKAHEEERQKAEMLAELDRAKTIFFSNISHEFRTPITLMLGPIEDLILRESGNKMVSQLELIHRNALRLLKLVNTLLDFSRIESGRMDAYFEPTDIAKLTKDLASIFRSACERAGLEFVVDCPPIEETIYLDADMYEKIVLNLISNAYKFTLKGHIAIRLAQLGPYAVQLSVEDTGSGIPEEHLPRLFERFHRVPESKGRSHEGTGIGLAMVAELVKIHGGTIQAFSKVNQGTVFVINFQIGSSHLPPERLVARTAKSSQSYTRSAEWWIGGIPTESETMETEISSDGTRSHILFCDDNADMREYIRSLLGDQYDLDIACDGVDALEMIEKRKPELILTDIMMPRLDGLGLLQKLRENPDTKTIPIIFLSARAGEEARVEGLKLGADDYLTKPFTARELQARIKTHLELCKARHEATEKAELANKAKDQFLAVLSHELRTPLTPALLLSESLQHYRDLPASTVKDLELITKNIKLEVRLIDDLLDVTKITKNKLVLTMAPVDAHDELRHTINLVKHDADDKMIQFEVALEAKDYFISADSSRLQQIFWNLVKNAVKFTPKHGTIRITTQNESPDLICVKVKDSGIGMEEELLPKIFESFQQGTSSITHQFGGLGLGLSISKALTELMHGKIWASSEGPGLGSEFTVLFPVLRGVQASPTPLSSAPLLNEPVPSQKILLVEDNKSTALVMTRFLKKLGHVVKTAYCVREALEMAQNNKFELVVSDLGLPDGNGFELMKSLHSNYGLRGICVSGYGMEEDLRKSRECGFDIHIVKPVEISSLRSAIAFVVQKIRESPLN